MKSILIIFLFYFCTSIFSQPKDGLKELEGKITFISKEFYYIEFNNTDGIKAGDTLYIKKNNNLVPCLKVNHISLKSCAAKQINSIELKNDNVIIALIRTKADKNGNIDTLITKNNLGGTNFNAGNFMQKGANNKNDFDKIKLSLSSYTNFDNFSKNKFTQRWRYLFNAYGDKYDKKISYESYIVINYNKREWKSLRENFGKSVKVYDLSLKYQINENYSLIFGRHNNTKISNIGSIDGVQFETINKSFFGGIILGSRPNNYDFGLNFKLFQYGFYLGRTDTLNKKTVENTVSFINQTNNFKTDRRFLYFQHSNTLINNCYIFLSTEYELYKVKNRKAQNKLDFTSLFLSINYSPINLFSINASYDARKNIYYYETYKSYLDSLLDEAIRQGFALRTNIRISNKINLSLNYGYRFKSGDKKTNNNFGANLRFNRVNYINTNINLSYNYLKSSYLLGNIYSIGLNRTFYDGVLDVSLGLKRINYSLLLNNYKFNQDILYIDTSLPINRDIFLSLYYEGTFEKNRTYSNIYFNISKQF